MRKVVVNSTPIIILGNSGYLELLKNLYGEISIPEAVFREVTAKADDASAFLASNPDWIHVAEVQSREDARIFSSRLHAGEVEVMLLAREQRADLVVIDDNAAKHTAKYLGLKVVGSLGILLKAKQEELIENIAPVLDKIVMGGFYIDEELKNNILKLAGER